MPVIAAGGVVGEDPDLRPKDLHRLFNRNLDPVSFPVSYFWFCLFLYKLNAQTFAFCMERLPEKMNL